MFLIESGQVLLLRTDPKDDHRSTSLSRALVSNKRQLFRTPARFRVASFEARVQQRSLGQSRILRACVPPPPFDQTPRQPEGWSSVDVVVARAGLAG
jgi:hypothetical protein